MRITTEDGAIELGPETVVGTTTFGEIKKIQIVPTGAMVMRNVKRHGLPPVTMLVLQDLDSDAQIEIAFPIKQAAEMGAEMARANIHVVGAMPGVLDQ